MGDDDPELLKKANPTFSADSISRRSSINLTSGAWDYITPKTEQQDLSMDNLSNTMCYDPYSPSPHIIRRNNTSSKSTPTYSSYKTRHEYLRDMNYFNTLHRAQQFKKLKKNMIKKKEKKQDKIGHRPQLSCDTQAAIEGGIEPYQPTKKGYSAMV